MLAVALALPQIAAADGNDSSAIADEGHPLAGWHNGLFYLRDPHDNFRLYPQGSAQIDAYTYFGPGVSDTTLKPTLLLRRIRPEVSGELFHRVWFTISGDFGATALDNPKGTNETSAASPGATPSATSGRYASAETAKVSAAPANVWIDVKAHALLNAQLGQFNAPFTLENRTSERYTAFMERSLAIRDVAIPTNKDIGLMLWGETPSRVFYYSAGVFNGAGQNRLSTDGRADVMGRVFFHPLATVADNELKDLQMGASARYGSRDKTFTAYDYPAMTTQGNFAFWSPTYAGATGQVHVIPSGDQVGFAGEVRIPVSRFDLTSEVVWIDNDTREALEGFELTNSERFGRMKGWSYYIQLGFWPFGKRDLNGLPGYDVPPHVDFSKPDPVDPSVALQVLAKWEQVDVNYASASRGGKADAKNIDGDIKVDAFSLGANFWWTKHVRFTANYVLNIFPGSEPVKPTTPTGPAQSKDQRALAPANTLAPGINDVARNSGHLLHELLFRVGVAL